MRTAARTGCIAFLLILILSSRPTLAATIHVPSGSPSIRAGIIAAQDGDLVLVAPGTYVENINFFSKAIIVQSEAGADATVIDGSRLGSVVTFTGGETEASVLDGFSITNGLDLIGAGIYCHESSPTISNSRIYRNQAEDHGGGIACVTYSHPTITNCLIRENFSSKNGGGIGCLTYSAPQITSCTIIANSTGHDGGGIVCITGSDPVVTECTISGNLAGDTGGGFYGYSSEPTITNCTVSDNFAGTDGGGIYFRSLASLEVRSCTITGNRAGEEGGGVYCGENSSPSFTNSTIAGNVAFFRGGGIYCGAASPTITHCTITNNYAILLGGGIYCASTGTVSNSIVWMNYTLGSEPEISPSSGSSLDVIYSDVRGGWTGEGNIDAAPKLIEYGGYHLGPDSPCIDAGMDAGIYDDIDGQARPWGAGFDMGADEFSTEPCSAIASTGNQFLLLYLIPALALIFFTRRFFLD